MPAYVREGGLWRQVQSAHVYQSGAWQELETIHARDGGPSGGTWREVYSKTNPVTRQWYASWSQAYREGGSPVELKPNQLFYGGWDTYDQIHDARSLIGLPVTSIRDFLRERRKVLGVRLRLQINGLGAANTNSAIDAMRVGGHDKVNQPGQAPDGSWVYAYPDPEAADEPGFAKGDPVWTDLPTTFGDDLWTGVISGLVLYYGQDLPGADQQAVYFFGADATEVRRPVLEITADYLD